MKHILILLAGIVILTRISAQTPTRSLFDVKTLGEIKLVLPQKNWSEALDSLRVYGKGMLEGEAIVDGKTYAGVGVRFRGNSSYQFGMKRNPFHIKLNLRDPEAAHQGYSTIKLSSALRDPSMVREMLFLEIAGKYTQAPKATYTKLYINGEYQGIYIIVESVDEKFVNDRFGKSRPSHLYKAGVDHQPKDKPSGCLENITGSLEYEQNMSCLAQNFEIVSDRSDYGPLHQLTNTLKNNPKELKNILDIDQTLWMLALNNVMVNLSSYTGKPGTNYYLYQDGSGKFHPILWDLNLSFGSFKNIGTGSDLELKDLQRLDPLLHANNPYKPLISKLLADPLNKKIYLAHMRQILDDYFHNGLYERRARELQGLIVVPYAEDTNKPYPLDQFQTSLTTTIGKKTRIPGIVELMSKRIKFLKNHPDLSALPSIASDIEFAERAKFDNQAMQSFKISLKADRYAKRVILYYRFDARDAFTAANLAEAGAEGDPNSGVRRFEGAVNSPADQAEMEYYLLIENSGAVSFSPTNYTQKRYKISMADINK